MKISKFLAATMAAMTIVSCSEQVTDLGGNIQPGDAVLSFNVGTNGGTTYATDAEETAVKSLSAFLQYKDGKGIAKLQKLSGATTTGLKVTLSDGTYTPGSATLYFVGNMPAATATTEEELLKLVDIKDIYTSDGKALTLHAEGMTATSKVIIDLKSGPVNTGTGVGANGAVTLKRLAARVYAASGTAKATDITGYKVDFLNVGTGANLFSYAGNGVLGAAPKQYLISGAGTGQHGGLEAVGYLYPSATDVTITVTAPDGKTKPVTFKPEANKNYKLLITPTKNNGAELDFSVSLAPYDNGSDLDANFTEKQLSVAAGVKLPAGVTVGTNGELVIDGPLGTSTTGVQIKFADLFAGKPEASLKSNGINIPSTLALTNEYKVSSDGMFAVGDKTDELGIDLVALRNYDSDKTYFAKFAGYMNNDQTTTTDYAIKVVLKGMNLPENFTTNIAGVEFMSVGYQGDLASTKALVAAVEAMSGSKFFDKAKTYVNSVQSDVNSVKMKGKVYTGTDFYNKRNTLCPAGFAVPTIDQITSVFGTLPALSSAQPIKVGANTLGKITLTWNPVAAPGIVDHSYYNVSDAAGNTLYVPNQSNLTMSEINQSVSGPTVTRIVFWNASLQYNAASVNLENTATRCVKIPQVRLDGK